MAPESEPLPPWLEPVAAMILARLDARTLPHALLLSGPPGWGEELLCNHLALRLLGLATDQAAALIAHPDLRWLQPEGSVIKVDDVRELVEFAVGTPQLGPRKVAVVTDAHALNRNAANALLKTLEEPPPSTHLLLCTAFPGRLLATIRSRCQLQSVRADKAAAALWLAQRHPGVDLGQLLFEHGGAPLPVDRAAGAGEQPLHPLLEAALARRTPIGPLVAELLEQGLTQALGRWYRHVLSQAAGEARFAALAAADGRALAGFADELLWVRRQLLTSNSSNERLLAERLVFRWRTLAGNGGAHPR